MAQFYDQMMGDGKYQGWKKLIARVVKQHHIATGKCLDVACGTGNITKLLLELGFRVVGVDISAEMVRLAQEKFPQENFVCADVRDFTLSDELRQGITLAVSFYDSLNYLLTDQDMLHAFQSVYRNLPSGTIFLFDMNTVAHVKAAQRYHPRVLEGKNFYSVYRFGGEGRFWTLNIDIFVKTSGSYRLAREQHTERGYDKKDILPLLQQVGFKPLAVEEEFKTYEDGIEHLSRLYFVVQKA